MLAKNTSEMSFKIDTLAPFLQLVEKNMFRKKTPTTQRRVFSLQSKAQASNTSLC